MLRIGLNPAAQASAAPSQGAPAPGGAPVGGPPPELLATLAQAGGADAPPDPTADPTRKSKQMYQADKAPQGRAGYQGPEMGPFKCSNCDFFDKAGLCHIVAGKIDPEGMCNNFLSLSSPVDPEGQDEPDPNADPGAPDEGVPEAPAGPPDAGLPQ